MIYGFVGTMDDFCNGSIRGNGKSLTMTYYLHQDFKEGRRVYTNYKTTFSEQVTVKKIVDMVLEGEIQEASIGIDEIQIVLNSIGTKAKVVNFIDKMVSQTRKIDSDIYYATQRYTNIHKRLRVQTDRLFRPFKIHQENDKWKKCITDRCKKPHVIIVKSEIPYLETPIIALDAVKVGVLYDSNEIINEEIDLK
ncbi:hypothetical protein KO361_05355 [Candidatus Woesearchaeota archaeon]|jgi:hypothetical protein|nr:hypothetical protein [Candidatus Woesearchaeota archaeon]